MDGRIDKTGTLQVVADNEVVVDDDRALAARVMEDREIQTIRDEVLEVHGSTPSSKPEGVTRSYTKTQMESTAGLKTTGKWKRQRGYTTT